MTAAEEAPPAPAARHALVFCLMLALLMVAFNQTILTTALPTIAGELDSVESMAWVIAGFVLTSTVTIPIYGSASDVLGRKGLFLAAIGLFTTSSAAAALSPTIELLIASRLAQGVGGGGLLVLSQAILADVVPVRERPRYAGAFGAVWAVASVAGPLLGGWFTEGPGWAWSFWINVPLGGVSFALALRFVRRSRPSRKRVEPDVVGMVLLTIATSCATLVAAWGGTRIAWSSLPMGLLGAATAAATATFLVVQARAAQPVMALDILRERNFLLATGAGLLTGGVSMFAVITYLPVYLQMVRGLSPTAAGLAMSPMIVTLLLVSTLTGLRVSRSGRYVAVTVTGCLVSTVGLVLLSTLGPHSSLTMICGYAAVFGAGLGSIVQLLLVVVQHSAPALSVGAATAANTYFRQMGAALGIAGVGSAFAARLAATSVDPGSLTPAVLAELSEESRALVVDAYATALPPLFLLLAPLGLVSAVLLLFLRNVRLGD